MFRHWNFHMRQQQRIEERDLQHAELPEGHKQHEQADGRKWDEIKRGICLPQTGCEERFCRHDAEDVLPVQRQRVQRDDPVHRDGAAVGESDVRHVQYGPLQLCVQSAGSSAVPAAGSGAVYLALESSESSRPWISASLTVFQVAYTY